MAFLSTVLGLAIAAWVAAMAAGLLLKTDGAKKWFGAMLQQNPTIMTVNGAGMAVIALIVIGNLLFPETIDTRTLMFALGGLLVSQISTLFMQIRHGAPNAARVAPVVLMILTLIYGALSHF